jgi:hypothetical protein
MLAHGLMRSSGWNDDQSSILLVSSCWCRQSPYRPLFLLCVLVILGSGLAYLSGPNGRQSDHIRAESAEGFELLCTASPYQSFDDGGPGQFRWLLSITRQDDHRWNRSRFTLFVSVLFGELSLASAFPHTFTSCHRCPCGVRLALFLHCDWVLIN